MRILGRTLSVNIYKVDWILSIWNLDSPGQMIQEYYQVDSRRDMNPVSAVSSVSKWRDKH